MDFRTFYTGGYLARTDPASLYDYGRQKQVQDALISKADGLLPFVRPAYGALPFAPLSRLSYRSAYFCFFCVNLLLLNACFFLGREVFSQPGIIAQPRPGLQLFAFFPVTITILQGQDCILFLVGLCLALRCITARKHFLAGVFVAVLLFKLQIALPLAVFLIARYGFSLFAGFAAGGFLVSAASVALVGWPALMALGRVLSLTGSVGVTQNTSEFLGVFPSAMPNLWGFFSTLVGWLLPGKVVFGLTVLLSVCIALWTIRILTSTNLDSDSAFALSTTCAILLSYHSHVQDLTVMLIPLGLMAGIKNPYISNSTLLLYLSPAIVAMFVHEALFLLAVPVMMFQYGISQLSPLAAARAADRRSFSVASKP